MALTQEWRGRIDRWRDVLHTLFYVKMGDVPLEGFVTREQLSPDEARRGPFRSMKPGTSWGAKWEYAWLRGRVKLPAAARGRRIVLRPELDGGESRSIINGREAGGIDRQHAEILLSPKGVPGASYDVLIECYAGHGPTPCGSGPVPDGVPSVPEPGATQRTLGASSFGIWEEEAFQLWIDVQTLLELRDHLDHNSLRVAEIDAGLRDFTLIADLELPRAEMLPTLRAARARLRSLLECRNGSTAPALWCVGHSHIDVAWLWPLAETERKCARTFGTQLALMEQYPEFRFLQSQPHLYWMAKRLYPEMYERIRKAARRGAWIPEGALWVEPDTNVAGGEALIRQFVHGKRFFREEFGVDCKLMWLPDVFGYSGALPQIMAGCGVKYFSTQKIFWNYNGGETFPCNSFWWEGIDGTRVLAHIHNDYNSHTNPAKIMQRWNERVQKDGIRSRLMPFGFGDGGGGPTRLHLEYLRRCGDLEGLPRTRQASPIDFFKDLERDAAGLPAYVGELYFQAHRGTLTSQARTKRGNRKGEFALREAEFWGAAARALAGFDWPATSMDGAWKGLLLNQFHDILPGSSIGRVYDEAEALYEKVLGTARSVASAAARKLAKPDAKAVTVFNSLSWERSALVALPRGFAGARAGGVDLPAQKIEGTTYVEAGVPSCGWQTLESARPAATLNALKVTAMLLENELIRARLNALGEIVSLIDKQTGRELAAAPMNSFRMFKDIPRSYDAWDIDSPYERQPVALPGKAEVKVVAAGPLVAVLRVRRTLGRSQMTQEVRLRRGSRRIDFVTRVDWREKHRLLKAAFPTTIHANEALHEVQFGHLARPNHRSRPFDADRFEVANQKWTALVESARGVAVLNDCKYGVNVLGGSINLTLLKSPVAPDMRADQGAQEFAYSLLAWNGSFAQSGVTQEAYDLNAPAMVLPGRAGEGSLFTVAPANVVLDTFKPAEDGSGDVIVRLYECDRAASTAVLRTALPVQRVCQTGMLEENPRALPLRRGAVALEFRPFEIKTLRLTLR